MSRTRWAVLMLAVSFASGCGDNSAYLPKPRPIVDDEEEATAVVQAAPAAGATPAATPAAPSATQPASSVVTQTPPAAQSPQPAPSPTGAPPVSGIVEQRTSEKDRRERVIVNLRKISAALESMAARDRTYPPSKCFSGRLSWRVMLLPALGRADLYGRFDFSEPWDGPHNKELIKEIPIEYISPERADGYTCIQMLVGAGTACPDVDPMDVRDFADGVDNTALVVEVHKDLARPWTAPEDYAMNPETIQRDLFGMRQDCCFAIFGGSTGVRLMAADISDPQLTALFSPSGGEPFKAADTTAYAHANIDSALRERLASKPLPPRFSKAGPMGTPANASPAVANSDAPATPAGGNGAGNGGGSIAAARNARVANGVQPVGTGVAGPIAASDARPEPPTEEQLAAAATIVRDLYADEFKRAKKATEKRDFAKKMLDEVEKVQADAAGKFVLLRAARDIASKAGDITTTIAACDQLARDFRIDPLSMKLKALELAATNLEGEGELDPLYEQGLKLGDEALALDDFNSARTGYRLAMNSARRSKKAEREYRISLREDYLRESKLAYARLADHLHTLVRSPADPVANAAVGRYFALVKQDWTRGLPMLARGDDERLRELANLDLDGPSQGEQQVAVADQWWELTDKVTTAIEKASATARARYWYEKAQPSLGASLHKLRVEKRISEAKKRSSPTLPGQSEASATSE